MERNPKSPSQALESFLLEVERVAVQREVRELARRYRRVELDPEPAIEETRSALEERRSALNRHLEAAGPERRRRLEALAWIDGSLPPRETDDAVGLFPHALEHGDALRPVESPRTGFLAPLFRLAVRLTARVMRPHLRRQRNFNRTSLRILVERAVRQERLEAGADDLHAELVTSRLELLSWGDHLRRLESKIDTMVVSLAELEAETVRRTDSTRAVARNEIDRLTACVRLLQEGPGHGIAGFADDGGSRYARFEEVFRGSREHVQKRARHYLEYLERLPRASESRPVLDLGCGRGEWLELLAERERSAFGVDLNPVFVTACRERGLDVRQQDALVCLEGRPSESLAMVTALHLAEHLQQAQVEALLRESFRCLVPGGWLIVETPNPENLVVGAATFYSDPSHHRPLLPVLMTFLLEQEGFRRVVVDRLREDRNSHELEPLPADAENAETINPLIELVNRHLLAPPDYCIAGQKPE